MNKDNIILLAAIGILLIALFSFNTNEDIREEVTIKRLESKTPLLKNWEQVIELAENISDRLYIEGVYDCSDMSDDLVILLRNNGYKASYVHGYKLISFNCTEDSDCGYEHYRCIYDNCYGGHAWVRVWIEKSNFNIEATSGRFIQPDSYFKFYLEE